MTSVDIFNHLGWKGLFTPDYVYRVFLALQLGTDGTVLTTPIEKGTRVNARSRKPRLSTGGFGSLANNVAIVVTVIVVDCFVSFANHGGNRC